MGAGEGHSGVTGRPVGIRAGARRDGRGAVAGVGQEELELVSGTVLSTGDQRTREQVRVRQETLQVLLVGCPPHTAES